MRQLLIDNKFSLNEYEEGKFWEKRTGRYSCLQANEELDTFFICDDGKVYSVTAVQFKDIISIK